MCLLRVIALVRETDQADFRERWKRRSENHGTRMQGWKSWHQIAGVEFAGEGKVWKAEVLKMCFWLYWLKIALWYSLLCKCLSQA